MLLAGASHEKAIQVYQDEVTESQVVCIGEVEEDAKKLAIDLIWHMHRRAAALPIVVVTDGSTIHLAHTLLGNWLEHEAMSTIEHFFPRELKGAKFTYYGVGQSKPYRVYKYDENAAMCIDISVEDWQKYPDKRLEKLDYERWFETDPNRTKGPANALLKRHQQLLAGKKDKSQDSGSAVVRDVPVAAPAPARDSGENRGCRRTDSVDGAYACSAVMRDVAAAAPAPTRTHHTGDDRGRSHSI